MEETRSMKRDSTVYDEYNLPRRSSVSTVGTVEGSLKGAQYQPKLSLPKQNSRMRDRSPGLQWHAEYTKDKMKRGRCLMIDYIQKEPGSLTRKVRSEEMHDLDQLRKVYKPRGPRDEKVALRVFHIQNWEDAATFMAHKFRLQDGGDILTGQAGFLDWVMEKRSKRRAGKPLLTARSWKVTTDPWRQVAKCSVGMDLMKIYPCNEYARDTDENPAKVTALMGYDNEDNPVHHKDVMSQRFSVYVQYALPEVHSPGPDVISPYHDGKSAANYDNGNTIIIFDNSESRSIVDTLIPARCEWESRWRRLPFHLVTMPELPGDAEDTVTGDCMRIITQDIFKAVAENWDEVLDAAWEHVSILETKIYEQPADESRAPELWENQAKWLVFEKLMYFHQDSVNDMRKYLVELDGDHTDAGQWLRESPDDFARITNLIAEDLLKRTSNLTELMYKSVGIRDSRESLRLGASMWRLSWITFIFLPANCLIAFFGMNVNILAENPSIQWFFVSAVPFFIVVIMLWWALKHFFAASRDMPVQRGAFEQLFTEMQNRRPEVWTRNGPREYVQPKSMLGQWKWRLILRWTTGEALPQPPQPDDEPIGGWNRIKRHLIRKWTNELVLVGDGAGEDDLEAKKTSLEPEKDHAIPVLKKSASVPVPKIVAGDSESDGSESKQDIGDENSQVVVEEMGNITPLPVRRTRTVESQQGVKSKDWAVEN